MVVLFSKVIGSVREPVLATNFSGADKHPPRKLKFVSVQLCGQPRGTMKIIDNESSKGRDGITSLAMRLQEYVL